MRKNRRHINYIKLSGSAKIHVNIFIRNVPEISYHTRGSGAEICQGNALRLIEERWGRSRSSGLLPVDRFKPAATASHENDGGSAGTNFDDG